MTPAGPTTALRGRCPTDAGAAGGSPWRSHSALATLAIVALLGLAIDLITKAVAFATIAQNPVILRRADVLASENLETLLPWHEPVVIVPRLLEFTLVLNPGAVFGIGAGARWFFIVFTVLAIGFGLWMFGAWTRRRDRIAHAAIGLLIAGGLGNLYDRLRFACVRDFIHPLPDVHLPFGWRLPGQPSGELWPYVSNVADLWLLIGIALLMIHLWRSGGRGREERKPAVDAQA